ncbi:MAG TPA: RDD family protein [Ginsengibacter sp.]|nr:RDD family protein [Ginsengibacter sp.]HRP44825.1 RDD family protein [Ginsengibacter sp.]
MPKIKIATVFNIELEFVTSDLPRRVVAYLVDLTILSLYFLTVKSLLYGPTTDLDDIRRKMGLDILVISLPMLLYSLICEVMMHGQSIGKRLLDIRVISLDGKEPTIGQFLMRWIFRAFEWPFFFGYTFFSVDYLYFYLFITGFLATGVVLPILLTPRNQRLGDLAAGTVVVKTRSNLSVDDTLYRSIEEKNYQARFPAVLQLSDRDINTILRVLKNFEKTGKTATCDKLKEKIKSVLHIETDMEAVPFLKALISDYNFLASKKS